jgi:hypothetical protein
MSTVYRIEIDIRIDNRTRTKVIQTAKEDYRKSPFTWTLEDGKPVEISAEEFVVDTKAAFLELAESAFRSVLPDIESDRLSCGLAEPELKMRAYAGRRPSLISRKSRTRSGCQNCYGIPVTDAKRRADLRRDRPNVSRIFGPYSNVFKRLAESAGRLFFRCYSTCYSSLLTSFSLEF